MVERKKKNGKVTNRNGWVGYSDYYNDDDDDVDDDSECICSILMILLLKRIKENIEKYNKTTNIRSI